MLTVIAQDFIKPEYIQDVMPLYQNLVSRTREEPLCISYVRRNLTQFLSEALFARFLINRHKYFTSRKITLLKARKTTMTVMGSHETGLSKAIFGAERDRRAVASNYARASVELG